MELEKDQETEEFNFNKKHIIFLLVFLLFCSMVYISVKYIDLENNYNHLIDKYTNECVVKTNFTNLNKFIDGYNINYEQIHND